MNHRNIVTIYDIGTTDSISWIAMERVDGKTVRELLFGGALAIRKLLPVAAQLADGLAAAHDALHGKFGFWTPKAVRVESGKRSGRPSRTSCRSTS